MREPLERAKSAEEVLDAPRHGDAELRIYLKTLGRLNWIFGANAPMLRELDRGVRLHGISGSVSVLDVGTGGADLSRAIVRWAVRRGLRPAVVACDRHEQVVEAAREFCAGIPEITVVKEDAANLPFPAGSFDFAVCSLLLHHLSEQDILLMLARLRSITRHAVVVNDLVRSRLGYAGVKLGTRLVSRNWMIRNDGPISVLRAFTLAELREIARRAGCEDMVFRKHAFFRMTGVTNGRGASA